MHKVIICIFVTFHLIQVATYSSVNGNGKTQNIEKS